MVTVLRVGWVIAQPKPVMMPGIGRLQHIAAKAVHGLLYLWLLAMPLSGWIMSNAAGYPVKVFGLFTMPTLLGPDKTIGGYAHEAHHLLATVGLVLIALHTVAALFHHYVLKNDTLRRMMPGYIPSAD